MQAQEVLGDPKRATFADETDHCMSKRSDKRKRDKEKTRAVMKADHTKISMPKQVSTRDKSHRELGLWAIDSVNPNAWAGAEEYLSGSGADFAGVQETKVDAAGLVDKEATSRNIGWSASLRECVLGPGGGNSAG